MRREAETSQMETRVTYRKDEGDNPAGEFKPDTLTESTVGNRKSLSLVSKMPISMIRPPHIASIV